MTPDNTEVPALTYTDPVRMEQVGAELSRGLRDREIGGVACWETSEDTVLAHVVARELAVRVYPAIEVEGIVSLLETMPPGSRISLVGESLSSRSLTALAGVVRHSGGVVVAIAVASGTVERSGSDTADAIVVSADSAR